MWCLPKLRSKRDVILDVVAYPSGTHLTTMRVPSEITTARDIADQIENDPAVTREVVARLVRAVPTDEGERVPLVAVKRIVAVKLPADLTFFQRTRILLGGSLDSSVASELPIGPQLVVTDAKCDGEGVPYGGNYHPPSPTSLYATLHSCGIANNTRRTIAVEVCCEDPWGALEVMCAHNAALVRVSHELAEITSKENAVRETLKAAGSRRNRQALDLQRQCSDYDTYLRVADEAAQTQQAKVDSANAEARAIDVQRRSLKLQYTQACTILNRYLAGLSQGPSWFSEDCYRCGIFGHRALECNTPWVLNPKVRGIAADVVGK